MWQRKKRKRNLTGGAWKERSGGKDKLEVKDRTVATTREKSEQGSRRRETGGRGRGKEVESGRTNSEAFNLEIKSPG